MNFLTDFHHGQLTNAMYLLFVKRLGFKMYILKDPQKWGSYGFGGDCNYAGYPMYRDGFNSLSDDDVGNVQIDLFLPTVELNDKPFKDIRDKFYPKSALVAQSGNEDMHHSDDYRHVITSAYEAERWYRKNRPDTNVLVYYPEIDLDLFKYTGVPTKDDYRKVRCYMPCLRDGECGHFRCRHCGTTPPFYAKSRVQLAQTYLDTRTLVKNENIELFSHGQSAYDNNLNYVEIPDMIRQSSLTWHYKVTEGWGFSALCSIACGRPVLTHPFWLQGATIMDFLIQDKTAIFSEFHPAIIRKALSRYMSSYDNVCEICEKTAQIGKVLFDYEYEAKRMQRFLENII